MPHQNLTPGLTQTLQIIPAVKTGWTRSKHMALGLCHPAWRLGLFYISWGLAGALWLGEGNSWAFFLLTLFSCWTVSPFDSTSGLQSRKQQRFILIWLLLMLLSSNTLFKYSWSATKPWKDPWELDPWLSHVKATSRRALSHCLWGAGRVDACSPKASMFPWVFGTGREKDDWNKRINGLPTMKPWQWLITIRCSSVNTV